MFVKSFPTNSCKVKPGHRAAGQESGRPKGGLAQLVRKNLNIKMKNLKVENFRIQGQVLEFPSCRLLWLNVYFPTDPLTENFDDEELQQVLRDIEKIMDEAEYDDVI